MSRSYYEYLKARDQWRIEHNLKIASFPYPQKDSIVYIRPSNNDFWERRRLTAETSLPFDTLTFTAEDTFHFISSVAAQEERKEREFLKNFFPQSELREGQSLTDQFNILFQGREKYERLLDRIQTARTKAQNGWKGMAPNMEALYGSYLNQRLTKALEDFRASFDANTDLSLLEERFRIVIDEAIIQAVNDIAAVDIEDEIYGSGKDWAQISDMISNDPYLRGQFISNMRAAIGDKNIQAILDAMKQQKQKGEKKQRTSTILREKLKLSARTASIGGSVIENTLAALAQALGQLRGGSGALQYSVSATAVHGEMVTTDAIMVFSGSVTVDTSAAVRALNEYLSNNEGSLGNAYYQMEKFYKQQKENLDELYTVFVNSKNYQLGGRYGKYEQKASGTLDELDDFLSRAGIHVDDVENFLLTAYNTASGAVYSSRKSIIQESIVNALKAAAVKFMFDDWQTLGTEQGNGIHMFLLSGKYVPSSVIFKAMADAGNQIVSSKASVTIPGIQDPGPEGWGGSTDIEVKQNIYQYWQDEYDRISRDSKWVATFVINVKRAIG